MKNKRKRYTSNPRNITVSMRVTKEEKEKIDNLADKLELTITDTLIQGIKALDEKYSILKSKNK